MRKFISIFELIVLHKLIVLINSSSCKYTFSEYGASFDLSPLVLTNSSQLSYYKVYDSRFAEDSNHNFSYEFNICGPVASYPSETSLCQTYQYGSMGYCSLFSNDTCLQMSNYTNKVYAYQLAIAGSNTYNYNCYRLSKEDGGPITWELLNQDNPSEGVVMKYDGGDYCDTYSKNRQLFIRFECENNYYNIPDSEPIIEDLCTYNITLKSIYGCPVECGVYSNSLCNDEGTCEYDWTNNYPKCFCYHGYTGRSCSRVSYNSSIPNIKAINTTNTKYYHTFQYIQTIKKSNGTELVNMSITYDLTYLHLPLGEYYKVEDMRNNTYDYYWQLLDQILPSEIPYMCENATNYCDININPSCTNISTLGSSKYGAAFQISKINNVCQLLGTGNENSTTWNLLDNDNPAKGVSITYYDGSYCYVHNANRKFTIEFECPDSTRQYFDIEEEKNITSYVYEDDSHACEYTIRIITALACPYQCVTEYNNTNTVSETTLFTVCNKQGICASDPNVNFTHCLCDDGWTGDYCQIDESTVGCDGVAWSNKTYDCAGVCNGNKANNTCGYCMDKNASDFNTYGQDCKGVCYGIYQNDKCGQCILTNNSEWNNCLGCDGVAWSNKSFDCVGECGGDHALNECEYCASKTLSNFTSYGKDCNGTCNGNHGTDDCGNCLLTSDISWNYCLGCDGVAWSNKTYDCKGVCGGNAVYLSCGVCIDKNDAKFDTACNDYYSDDNSDSNKVSLTIVIIIVVLSIIFIIGTIIFSYRLWKKKKESDDQVNKLMKQYTLMDKMTSDKKEKIKHVPLQDDEFNDENNDEKHDNADP